MSIDDDQGSVRHLGTCLGTTPRKGAETTCLSRIKELPLDDKLLRNDLWETYYLAAD